MYGYIDPNSDRSNDVRNELSITNLISIANNPVLFGALDEETKTKVVQIICTYTKQNIEMIEKYSTYTATMNNGDEYIKFNK